MFVEHNEKVLPHLISLFLSLRRGDWRQPNVSPHKIKTDRVSVPETFSTFSFFTSSSYFFNDFFSLSISILFLFYYLFFPSLFYYFFWRNLCFCFSHFSLQRSLSFFFEHSLFMECKSDCFQIFYIVCFFFVVVFALSDNFHVLDLFLHSSFSTCFVCACAHVKEVSFLLLLF